MDTTREQQLENELDADFSVSVEGFRAGADRKRLCIRRGSHTESVAMSDAEAQAVMISLMSAFPGPLSELLEAARPLADLLEYQYPAGEMHKVQVDGGDVARLQNAIGAIDKTKPAI
jgi:hypothetical protein